jgi:glutamate-ammonia-ligase adenylyltransferase
MQDLSTLAETCIQIVLENVFENMKKREGSEKDFDKLKERFCVMALGKLGGNELNYSSDIDLVGIWSGSETLEGRTGDSYNEDKNIFTNIMGQLSSDLSSHTEEGYAYRVDLRLRPYGSAGELICATKGFIDYYKKTASLWEIQAALKLRPVAGNLILGYDFLKRIRPILLRKRNRADIVSNIEEMRNAAIKASAAVLASTLDVKSGIGGLRDVEFLVQGLQLIHAPNNPMFIEGNTLLSMELLAEEGVLPLSTVEELREDYLFLRRTEHSIQLLEDRQTHSLPDDENELASLAKRMLGVSAGVARFRDRLNNCLNRVRKAYIKYLLEG